MTDYHKNNIPNSVPLVSVMIPVYNNGATIAMALNSVLNQTFSNWECIIVNDGSTDNTKSLIESYSDSRFKIVNLEKNSGRPFARQKALEIASGKYLAFLDADDFYHPLKLEEQVNILEQNEDVEVVSCGDASYNVDFELITYRGVGNGVVEKFNIGKRLKCAMRTAMIRMDIAKQFSYDLRLKHAQDTNYLMRLMHNKKYIVTPTVRYYYSEFSSVTLPKIIRTYYFSFLNIWSLRSYNLLNSIKVTFLIISKFFLTLLIAPVMGVGFFLKRRGKTPTNEIITEFRNTLNALKSIS